ncbi:hypothetical protein KM043_010654 [Ampulex compressa]|nr:hypothetical protein KM043_010654 [Ampulex compressa]
MSTVGGSSLLDCSVNIGGGPVRGKLPRALLQYLPRASGGAARYLTKGTDRERVSTRPIEERSYAQRVPDFGPASRTVVASQEQEDVFFTSKESRKKLERSSKEAGKTDIVQREKSMTRYGN